MKVNKINTWKSKVPYFWSLWCSENEVQNNCYLKAQPFSRWGVWKRIPFQLMIVHACSNKRLRGLNWMQTLPLYLTIMDKQFLPQVSECELYIPRNSSPSATKLIFNIVSKILIISLIHWPNHLIMLKTRPYTITSLLTFTTRVEKKILNQKTCKSA